jgi:transcriptional regulator with XRE-family HTH domain
MPSPGARRHRPPGHPSAGTPPDQVAVNDQVNAARLDLGLLLKAWRKQAGYSQQQLAHRTPYARSTIAGAEAGGPAGRELFEAADPVVGAQGRLLAACDQTAAIIAALRHGATRRVRAIEARAAALALTATANGQATTQTATCPHCRQLSVMTLTAVPPTSPEGVS